MNTTSMINAMWDAVVEAPARMDSLMLRARAYQVLYTLALGDESYHPRTLTDGEAVCLVGVVAEMDGTTYLDCLLARRMSPALRRYCGGTSKMGRAHE